MKKIYQTPALHITPVSAATMIAISVPTAGVDTESEEEAGNLDVKGSTPSYNVWDDDWNK